jgi:membrane fusion protein (multidrug efflux system)
MENEQNQATPTATNQPDVAQAQQNTKARNKIGIFLTVIAIAAISYGAYWGLYASHFEDTEDAYVSAVQNAITSQIDATVISVNIQDGQTVQQGQVAVSLDNTDYKLALDKASADLASAVKSYVTLQYDKNQNQDSVNNKKNDLSHAKDNLDRDTASYHAGVLTKEQYDETVYKYKQAQIELGSAQTSFSNASYQALAKDVWSHPDVQKSINAYRQAYINLYRTQIRVPVNGTVAKKSVFVGQKISANQTLFSIINLDNEWIDANLKESQLKNVVPGQSVELTSDVNGKKYKGYVTSIQAGSGSALSLLPAQNATGNWIKIVQRVPVRIDLDKQSLKDNGPVPIGTSVRISIDTRTKGQATINQQENTTVYQVDEKEITENIQKIMAANITKSKK